MGRQPIYDHSEEFRFKAQMKAEPKRQMTLHAGLKPWLMAAGVIAAVTVLALWLDSLM